MNAISETTITEGVDLVNTISLIPPAGLDGPPEQDNGYFEALVGGGAVVPKPAELKPIAPKYPLRAFDAADICLRPVAPPLYLIDKFLPHGTIDLFSPPECAKSTLLLTMIDAIVNNRGSWMGFKCSPGKVLALGGEKSSPEVWRRDFDRLGIQFPDANKFLIIDPHTYIWEWDKKSDSWGYSQEALESIIPAIHKFKPDMVIVDTMARYACGSDPGLIAQQVKLGLMLQQTQRDLNVDVLMTVSHTPQCTEKESLYGRLSYTARAGGNGVPGILRYMISITELRPDERKNAGINEERNRVLAIAAAKHSELPAPQPYGSKMNPLLVELLKNGSIEQIPGDNYGSYAVKGDKAGDEGETQAIRRKNYWEKKDAKTAVSKAPKTPDWLDILEAGIAALRASGVEMQPESKRADDGLPWWSLSQRQQALEAGRVALGLSVAELQDILSPGAAGASDNYNLPFPGTPAPPAAPPVQGGVKWLK